MKEHQKAQAPQVCPAFFSIQHSGVNKSTMANCRKQSPLPPFGKIKFLFPLLIFAFCLLPFAFASQWRQALPPYEFSFGRDHASHPDYKVEWWYYTGNLVTKDNKRFGYQLTFFRVGVDKEPQNPSRWAVRELYMAHLAVSDLNKQQFRFTEKLNRAGVGWAGAATDGYRVWNEDWEAKHIAAANVNAPLTKLTAAQAGISIDFELEQGKAPIIHGARGVSQKGAQAGNASHYYSLTRMPTRGTVMIDGERYEVSGLSWMDHEFGTSFLEKEQKGWDWLAIQLDDGSELMLYQFRRSDQQRDAHTSGTLVEASGKTIALKADDFILEPNAQWLSPRTGAKYPVAWKVKIPAYNIDLLVWAATDDQELMTTESTGVSYWEGAIEIRGTRNGKTTQGRGYLEMTGYSGAPLGAVLQ
jgi:predicted secreted hydrolase